MNFTKKLSTCILILVSATSLHAQNGQIDSSFNVFDQPSFLTNSNFNDKINNGLSLSDGSYIAVGSFTSYRGTNVNRVAKINNNGTLNTNFNIGTGPNGDVRGITQLQNGGFILFGNFSLFDGVAVDSVVKLFPNGQIDLTFQLNSNPITKIHDVAEFSNGDLILCGYIVPNGSVTATIIKTNSTGQINAGFTFPTINGGFSQVLVNSLDDVFIFGTFNQLNGYTLKNIAKIDINGVVNPNFVVPAANSSYANEIILDTDSTLFVSGNPGVGNIGIFRTFANGAIDTNFISPSFWGRWSSPVKDLNGGYFVHWTNNQWKTNYHFNSNGSIISSFNQMMFQELLENQVFDLKVDPTGKLVQFGQNGLKRLLNSGSLDPVFEIQTGANGPVDVIKILPTGKILIAGGFTSINGVQYNGIARLLADGTPDVTFNSTVGFIKIFPYGVLNLGGEIRAIDVQLDGKILVGGKFNSYNNRVYKNLVRLLPNGEVDTTFQIGNGISAPVNDIVCRADGKIVIGGEFYYYDQYGPNYSNMMYVGVLNNDGSRDISTSIGNLQCTAVKKIKLLPNGKLLLAGPTSYNFITTNGLCLINPDGTIDPSLNLGSGFNSTVTSIDIQSDNKILVGGSFSTFNGQNVSNLVRLLTDGTLDLTFNAAGIVSYNDLKYLREGYNGFKYIIAELANGTGTTNRQVARLNNNGSLDPTFFISNSNPYQYHDIRTLDFNLHSGIIVGGNFQYYNGEYRNYYTTLVADTTTDSCQYLTLNFSNITPLSCSDTNYTSVSANNGYPPYSFSWDNSTLTINDTVTLNTWSGIHQVSVVDSLGCNYSTGYLINGAITQTSFDFSADMISGGYRPGLTQTAFLHINNLGCQSTNSVVSLIYDTLLLDTVLTFPPVSYVSGDTLFWNLNSLTFDSLGTQIVLVFETDTTAQIGDSVQFNLSVNPISGDYNQLNNSKSYNYPIVNSYDPNEKQVYPVGACIPHYIDRGEKLTYTVHFQNTGTAEAIDIHILDTISSNLDLNTLRVLGASHQVFTQVYSNNVIDFKFNAIHLPDSISDPIGSQGYVIFEIEQNGYLYPGTEILNKVNIYFDFNLPVETNVVKNTISDYYQYDFDQISSNSCDSIFWEGNYYTTSGIYHKVHQNKYGCDSVRTLNLVLNSTTYDTVQLYGLDSVSYNNQTYVTSGNYNQTLINSNGCDSIIELTVSLDFTGIENLGENEILLFPNPTTGSIHVQIPSFWEEAIVKIYTINGIELYNYYLIKESSTIDMPNEQGVYIVQIINSQGNINSYRVIRN